MADGPLTVLPNLRVVVDANGYLVVQAGVTSGSDSPLRSTFNTKSCTDTSAHLIVAFK